MFDYSLNQSSPVASYIDEVYKGNFSLFGVEMYDLERIEVLRGPQGTLYGKNTTGGAINFITHKPGFDTEGDIKVGAGDYNRREVEGEFQTGRRAGRASRRDSRSPIPRWTASSRTYCRGIRIWKGCDQYGVRLSLLYKATDDLDFTLRLSKSMQDPQNYAIIDGRIPPPSPGNPGGSGFTGYFRTLERAPTAACRSPTTRSRRITRRGAGRTTRRSSSRRNGRDPTNKVTSITSWDEGKLFNPEGTDGAPSRDLEHSLHRQDAPGHAGSAAHVDGRCALAIHPGCVLPARDHLQLHREPDIHRSGVQYLQRLPDCAASSFGPGRATSIGSNIQSRLRLFQLVRPDPQQLGDLHRRQLQTSRTG